MAYGRDAYGVAPYAAEVLTGPPGPVSAIGDASLPAIIAASTAIAGAPIGIGIASLPAITAAGVAKALAGAAASATLPALTAAGLAAAPTVATSTATLPAITASATAHAEGLEPQAERLGVWPNNVNPFVPSKRRAPPAEPAPELIEPETISLPDLAEELRLPPVGSRGAVYDRQLMLVAALHRMERRIGAAERRAAGENISQRENAEASETSTPSRRPRPRIGPPTPAREEPFKSATAADRQAQEGQARLKREAREARERQEAIDRLIEEASRAPLPAPAAIAGAEDLDESETKMLAMMVAAAEVVWRR